MSEERVAIGTLKLFWGKFSGVTSWISKNYGKSLLITLVFIYLLFHLKATVMMDEGKTLYFFQHIAEPVTAVDYKNYEYSMIISEKWSEFSTEEWGVEKIKDLISLLKIGFSIIFGLLIIRAFYVVINDFIEEKIMGEFSATPKWLRKLFTGFILFLIITAGNLAIVFTYEHYTVPELRNENFIDYMVESKLFLLYGTVELLKKVKVEKGGNFLKNFVDKELPGVNDTNVS